MKEATGELNMTVVTVVAIAAVAAFFYAFVWPSIKNSIGSSTACANGPGTTSGEQGKEGYTKCENVTQGQNTYTCSYFANGKTSTTTCTVK